MQLRGCDHTHFIQAVRDGVVRKVVNVSHGRPALVFKKASDIYGFHCNEITDPPSRVFAGKRFRTSQIDPIKVKVEVLDHPVKADQWHSELNSSGDTLEHDDDLDELNFGNVTLQQMRERCRMKKRRQSSSVTVSGKNCTGFSENESCSSAQLEEDDIDFKSPLIKWKTELKNAKSLQNKSKRKLATASFKNAIVVEKTKQTLLDPSSLQPDWDLPMPLPKKVEFTEDYPIGHEIAPSMPGGSFSTDTEVVESYFLCAREEIQHVDEGISHIELSLHESHAKDVQDDQLNSTYDKVGSSEDIMEIRDYTDNLQSAEREEEYTMNDGFHLNVDNMSLLSDAEPIPTHHSIPEHVKLVDAELSLTFETRSAGHPTNNCMLNFQENPSSSCTISSPSAYDSSENKEELSQVPSYADSEETYFDKSPSSDAVSVQTSSERIENNGSPDWQHGSQRLNSSRKVISPTSQERLCKAMRSQELSYEGPRKCRGKLHYGKQKNIKIPFVERKDQVRVSELTVKLNKQKDDRTGSLSEGIQKIHPLSGATSSQTGAECNITRSSSESAIAFSQRQMKDIENLVLKLVGALKSVKEIAEDASNSGACLSTQSKYNPDEVQVRIQRATKAEGTAKRWLSMMARDCSRFCKIMILTEDCQPAPESVTPKKRKVSFADEVGRDLCDIREPIGCCEEPEGQAALAGVGPA
ncbi:hypothetical protein SAY86_028717 [Trapa natans]|uniref:Uncharacterized protein n=1 Tax=Trapa natans TaxID=22666 RepID=A0AAN7M006_TRANT|nr:hypothetical protein SAY86_028717 [Trapa natans]